jgi:quercetin dioxygenase-like cupin family protein
MTEMEDARADSRNGIPTARFVASEEILSLPRVSTTPRGHSEQMSLDPTVTNPDNYRVVFENESVRVLDYTDSPGDRTTPHEHPDSVMYALSSFRRRLSVDGRQREVEITAGTTSWLPAQRHSGENIGDTPTHVIFVELKNAASESDASEALGPIAHAPGD